LDGDHFMMRGLTLIVEFVRRAAACFSLPALVVSGAISVAAVALVYLGLAWAAPILPMNTDLYALNRPAGYTFLDEKGEFVGRRGAVVGERLSISEMPPYLPQAFLAMEDRRFYQHDGIDFRGLARAAWADIKSRRFDQGGSTITQQLVKILFLTPDRTITRKLVEMAGARQLEKLLTKDQILELYLNRIYLGAGAYGVDGAAHAYFGKSARDLTLAEAAMLASLTNAPTLNSPRRNLKTAQQRSGRVLRAMVTYGTLKESEIADALAHPATIVAEASNTERNYFLDTAADEAKSLAPGATGDLTIVTTLNVAMQNAAVTSIETVMKKRGESGKATQAALVAMNPDGAVRAMMGGRNYSESAFNRVTNAHRSPGSAFKPFVYLTALEQGLARDTIRYDEPIEIKDWSPDNFDGTYSGPVTLQAALTRSINTVAINLGQEVGLPAVISTAQRLGISSPLEPNASLAIGTSEVTPLELTAAYASFASLGLAADPYTVIEIRTADGSTVYRRAPQEQRRVITEDNALAMNAMLFDVVLSGTGRGAAVRGREVAGKTGTSADFRDAWFIGYSPELVAGVWVGNDDFTPMKKVTGGAIPAQIWSGFMQASLKGTKAKPLPRAEPIIEPPLIAEGERENFFDRLGGFFDRLFNNEARARTRMEPPPQSAQPQPPRPAPQAEATPDSSRDRYAYPPRDYYEQPPREPSARAEREYARDRYANRPQNVYPPPRRNYGYNNDPRYGRYEYGPRSGTRYGYDPRDDYERRQYDRDPRYYDRRYRY
jgi:penicillin-binding protein 1A